MSLINRVARRTLIGGVAAATLVAAPLVVAHKGASDTNDVLKLRGGATEVTLDAGTAGVLGSLGVSVAPTGHAYATKSGAIRFPIPRGEVDAETLAGQIQHSGGLKFSAGKTSLKLNKYNINIDAKPDLSARVNNAWYDRIELFDVDVSGLKVGQEKGRTVLSGVKLTLTDDAAAALNATFGVDAFAEGIAIGDAVVRTKASPRTVAIPKKLSLRHGATTVALDPATAGVLTQNGVTVAPEGVAKAGASGISFPVYRGKVDSSSLAGKISHRGVLSLSAGKTKVRLYRFVIDTTSGELTGVVRVNNKWVGRIPLFKLGTDELQTVQSGRRLRLTDVKLTLTKDAAGALNSVFGVTFFAEDLSIGKAKVRTAVVNRRHR